jgi:hypothetical protein
MTHPTNHHDHTTKGDEPREIELTYIESGTFQGGEEDAFNAGFEMGETYQLVEKSAFDAQHLRACELEEKLVAEEEKVTQLKIAVNKATDIIAAERARAEKLAAIANRYIARSECSCGDCFICDFRAALSAGVEVKDE